MSHAKSFVVFLLFFFRLPLSNLWLRLQACLPAVSARDQPTSKSPFYYHFGYPIYNCSLDKNISTSILPKQRKFGFNRRCERSKIIFTYLYWTIPIICRRKEASYSLTVSFLVTLSDLHGHLLIAGRLDCDFLHICAAADKISTDLFVPRSVCDS